MADEWINTLVSRFPFTKALSAVVVIIFLTTGVYLVKGETSFSFSVGSGLLLFLIAILLGIFSYADYRAREGVAFQIQHYKGALEQISQTHADMEGFNQQTIASAGEQIGSKKGKSSYRVEGEDATGTN